MDIHQLNLSYLPAEDRLLLRVSTRQGNEFAVWLTRKLTLGLWQALQGCAQHHATRSFAGKADVSDPALRKELAAFSSAKHLQAADFSTPYSPAAATAATQTTQTERTAQSLQGTPNYAQRFSQPNMLKPDIENATPLLPVQVVLHAQADGRTQMELKEAQRQMGLMLDETLLFAIIELLEKTVTQADWGIILERQDTPKMNTPLN